MNIKRCYQEVMKEKKAAVVQPNSAPTTFFDQRSIKKQKTTPQELEDSTK